jgi:hypothetical protein
MEYNARRPLDENEPDGYLESDRDYLLNNHFLAVGLLDAYGSEHGMKRFLFKIMTSSPEMLAFAAQIFNDPENPAWEEL